MDYLKIYNSLIAFRQVNLIFKEHQYCEKHHIIPRSLNGSDDKDNIVNLTAREHYIAHLLLWKQYKQINNTNAYIKMAYALGRLMTGNVEFIKSLDQHFNSHLYEKYKIDLAKVKRLVMTGKVLKDRKKLYDELIPIFHLYKYDLTEISYNSKATGFGNFNLVKTIYLNSENSLINRLKRYVPEFNIYLKELHLRRTIVIVYNGNSYNTQQFLKTFNMSLMIFQTRIKNYFKYQHIKEHYPVIIKSDEEFKSIFLTKYYDHNGTVNGYIWINNGKIERYTKPEKIPNGFVRGRLNSTKQKNA